MRKMAKRLLRTWAALVILAAEASAASTNRPADPPSLPHPPALPVAVVPNAALALPPSAPAGLGEIPTGAGLPSLPGSEPSAEVKPETPVEQLEALGEEVGAAPEQGQAPALNRAYDAAPPRSAVDAGDAPPAPTTSASPSAGASPQVDPPFYGRQKPAGERPKTVKFVGTTDQSERARAALLEIGAKKEEIFNAPTWFEKAEYPDLKKAVFSIAMIDEALTDIANGQEADIPEDLSVTNGDLIESLLSRRAQMMAAYSLAVARIKAEVHKQASSASRARENARIRLEMWHEMGLATPALEKDSASLPEEYRLLASSYQEMREIAGGRKKSTQSEVNALAEVYLQALKTTHLLKRARSIDALIVVTALGPKVTPEEAKAIYDRSVSEARDLNSLLNVDHINARFAALGVGVFSFPMLGKQIRPTCTVHMLRSLLAAMGVRREMEDLVREARDLLGDPYVGMTTAFNYDQQVRLFRHYGRFAEVRGTIFENLLRERRGAKVSIEIGDPVYKHSLLVEGFYEMYGVTYIALRDSTSYFPTRMTVEDFAKLLTSDNAVIFLEAYLVPQAGDEKAQASAKKDAPAAQ